MAESEVPTTPERDQTIRFHYLKSPRYHTLHADGAIGGPTPRGGIHLAFYAERAPIPTETEHPIGPDGKLGPEILGSRVTRDGIVRELCVDIVMDRAAAESLHAWLGKNLERLKDLE